MRWGNTRWERHAIAVQRNFIDGERVGGIGRFDPWGWRTQSASFLRRPLTKGTKTEQANAKCCCCPRQGGAGARRLNFCGWDAVFRIRAPGSLDVSCPTRIRRAPQERSPARFRIAIGEPHDGLRSYAVRIVFVIPLAPNSERPPSTGMIAPVM